MEQTEYKEQKVKPLVQIVGGMVKKNPAIADNNDYLWANVCSVVPVLHDKTHCFNCGRSMKIMVYEADLLDALLILAMAKQVKENMQRLPFTEANKVHLPTLQTTQGILKRQTKCDYLGLIKQSDNWRGSGYWALTSWAWKALRGEPIPAKAKYWEGEFLGRSDETTTLAKMFITHTEQVLRAIQKRNAIRTDHRAKFEAYDPNDWAGENFKSAE